MIGQKEILKFANELVGVKEIGNNESFDNQRFDQLMDIAGHQEGQAWCPYTTEVFWTAPTFSGKSKVLKAMLKNFSANAVRTYENFAKDDLFICDKEPVPAAVGIMAKYKDGKLSKIGEWTLGHAVLVESVDGEYVNTIEGNTNAAGSREGEEIAKKKRKLNFDPVQNGLVFVGFIKMKDSY